MTRIDIDNNQTKAANANNNSRMFEKRFNHVCEIGEEIVSKHSASVDRDARFPHEAFEALKAEGLMGAYVPEHLGGMGMTITQLGALCYELGHHCGSTAMIFAMHQIMVACIVHHHESSDYLIGYLENVSQKQWLLASGHSEIGTGGDLAISKCALEPKDQGFSITKLAPVISYAEDADAIALTCRRGPEAQERDQVQIILNREDYVLERLSDWDTLGMRGTCSLGYTLNGTGKNEQIFPVPFSNITKMTMSPVAHILWGYLWAGIANDAFEKARIVATGHARKKPGTTPPSVQRLSQADSELFLIRSSLANLALEYEQKLSEQNIAVFDDINFAIKINNLKVTCSEKAFEVVMIAMMICGIAGYRNDSELSLGRNVRDIISASIMINNDRLLGNCGVLHTSV